MAEQEIKAAATGMPTPGTDGEHYEEVAEYRVGEGAPPIALVVIFALIIMWAMTSWVPFFGY